MQMRRIAPAAPAMTPMRVVVLIPELLSGSRLEEEEVEEAEGRWWAVVEGVRTLEVEGTRARSIVVDGRRDVDLKRQKAQLTRWGLLDRYVAYRSGNT